jgi:hypothetical protein
MKQQDIERLAEALANQLRPRPADVEHAQLLADLDSDRDVPWRPPDPRADLEAAIRSEAEYVRQYLAALEEAAREEGVAEAAVLARDAGSYRDVARLNAAYDESMTRAKAAKDHTWKLRADADPHLRWLRVLLFIRSHLPPAADADPVLPEGDVP